jgi:hypothetical protein
MATRSFTREQLDAFAAPPAAHLATVIATGTVDEAVAAFARHERSYRNFVDGFHAFVAAIQEFVLTHHGDAAVAALDRHAFRAVLADAVDRGLERHHLDDTATAGGLADAFRTLLEAGKPDEARAVFARFEESMRVVHDIAVGQVAACLTHVYRTYGVDALEACIRHCGDRTLLGWMPHDLARPAHERVGQWARMMVANFASVHIDETDDAFVITQDPCGTCTRQIQAGRYAGPDGYAVVHERHPITWGRGEVPIYRTHVAVMHDLMPRERIGRSWPEITCPEGLGTGACRIVLRKTSDAAPPA